MRLLGKGLVGQKVCDEIEEILGRNLTSHEERTENEPGTSSGVDERKSWVRNVHDVKPVVILGNSLIPFLKIFIFSL